MFTLLLSALDDDDRDFVTSLYNEYGDRMYSIALSILKNEQDASDAVQETLYKIIKHIDKFSGDSKTEIRNKILIGLRASIYNASCDQYRKKRRQIRHEAQPDANPTDSLDSCCTAEMPEEILIKKEDCQNVKKAMLELSPDLQDAVNLVYFCDFSCREAASYLGITDGALRNRLFQALKKLKKALRSFFYDHHK